MHHFENGIKIGSRWCNPFSDPMKNGEFKIFGFILLVFYQNYSGDHIHAPIFSNRVSFFQQESILSADYVFRAKSYVQGT